MTNGMNKSEIETLSYHSSLCKCPECEKNPVPKQPNKLTAQTIEKSERGEGLHEVSNAKDLMRELNKPEQPNQQIMLIKTIQGLTTAMLHDISKLPESVLKDQAYDDMNIFETGILFRLQKEYE